MLIPKHNGQSTLLLYCCEDVKSHRSGGDTVPLNINIICIGNYTVREVLMKNRTRVWRNVYSPEFFRLKTLLT